MSFEGRNSASDVVSLVGIRHGSWLFLQDAKRAHVPVDCVQQIAVRSVVTEASIESGKNKTGNGAKRQLSKQDASYKTHTDREYLIKAPKKHIGWLVNMSGDSYGFLAH
jgi:hypothetical protein